MWKKFLNIITYYNENGILITLHNYIYNLKIILINRTIYRKYYNSRIGSNARIIGLKHIYIGKNFNTGKNVRIEAITVHRNRKYAPKIIIKDNVSFNDYVHIGATNYVEIGNNVLLGSGIYISDHNHGYYNGNKMQSDPYEPPGNRTVTFDNKVIINDNVWIGEHVSILPGVTIGYGAIIGANSVVTKDIPCKSIAVGNPARVIKVYNKKSSKWESI